SVRREVPSGAAEVAESILELSNRPGEVMLVASQGFGENAVIAEMAMREARPGHRILRASRVLGTSSWSGRGYRLLYDSPEEIQAYLDSVPVDLLVIDARLRRDRPQDDHTPLLLTLVEQHPDLWPLVGSPSPPG